MIESETASSIISVAEPLVYTLNVVAPLTTDPVSTHVLVPSSNKVTVSPLSPNIFRVLSESVISIMSCNLIDVRL